jgi:hypothetical protein
MDLTNAHRTARCSERAGQAGMINFMAF